MIESILADYHSKLGQDYESYLNHTLRVNAIANYLSDSTNSIEIEVASAFHDLGLWVYSTMDYIDPSVTFALNFLEKKEINADRDLVVDLISNHHKLTNYKDNDMVESFRKADLIDLTNGIISFQFPKENYSQLVQDYPRFGFSKMIIGKALRYAIRNPLRPLPMMRL